MIYLSIVVGFNWVNTKIKKNIYVEAIVAAEYVVPEIMFVIIRECYRKNNFFYPNTTFYFFIQFYAIISEIRKLLFCAQKYPNCDINPETGK